jgi:hypothetical protein
MRYEVDTAIEVLRDRPDHIELHIHTGDYFRYLSTMLSFFEEFDAPADKLREVARELRIDLHYVDTRYAIEPKSN